MFRKLSSLRKKPSDEPYQGQSHQILPKSSSRNSSRSDDSVPAQDEDANSVASMRRSLQGISSTKSLQKGGESDAGPLGLNVVYTPENGHKVDIVFIHGLGGTSQLTWSKYKDPELFWPLTFLPLEPDLCLARILTFGYNANFRRSGNISTSILDFAKDLLFDLKYAKDEEKNDLNMGNVPLIFVVHSMGGLIVKEAYMQGQNDPEYEPIIRAISAITFLATPHRGTNLAEKLNRILQTTLITNSKQYISDLAKNSFTLQKLNEQFRHIAPRLDIVSFYETEPTAIGLKNARLMILEKDSSVLGYPGETSKALNADHHGVCKYDSPRDPNYITVRNVLKSLVSKMISTSKLSKMPVPSRKESHDLKALLSITEVPNTDYIFFKDQWMEGTNEWIFEETSYLDWLSIQDRTARLLWLNGGAATGKSVLSSFIINNLVEQGLICQYFFIRFGDQKKRRLNTLLLSIAYQVALRLPAFMQSVIALVEEGIDFGTAEPRTVWERIFKSILFEMQLQEPLFWIIDGIDEADDPRAIIRLLSDTPQSVSIRIMLISRRTSEITTAMQKVLKSLTLESISIEGHLEDLQCYVNQELSMAGNADFRSKTVRRIFEGAQNNFLWVRLAVDKLNMCHRQADVELALEQLPVGMQALYDRMAGSINQNSSPTDRAFALSVLQCVTCSLRVLTVAELSEALEEDTSEILDLQRSIVDLCGGFVVVDNGGNIAMVHQTAREYLFGGIDRPFHINRQAAHDQMLMSCMQCLMTPTLRAKVSRGQAPAFLEYASTSWSSHLALTSPDNEQILDVLKKFLTGQWVLTWIQVLAAKSNLRILIQASKQLLKFSSKKKREYDIIQTTWTQQMAEQELLESWAVDFVKIVGKFGKVLQRNPESIYKLIPPFCPQSSSIYQLFGKSEVKSIRVSGISTETWDDSLASITLGNSSFASSLVVAGCQISVLASSGNVYIHDSSTFEEALSSPIKHGERVYRAELNSTATLLATYGYRTTKVWETSTGECKLSIPNVESRPRPLAILLVSNTMLLVGSDDRRIRSLDLTQSCLKWELVAELDEPELDGHFLNSSNYMALSKDGSLAAVAYRGHPLSAWEVHGPVNLGHCWRKREEVARGEVIKAFWHPHYPELLGLYIEGVVFRWRPYDGEVEEIAVGASQLAINTDGNIFATGDVHGTIKVFITSDLCPLCQVTSQDVVLGIAFSPDSRRLYDIRGYYANVWEPSALLRFADRTGERTGAESETTSLAQNSSASVGLSQRIDTITVLVASPLGHLYCYGTEKGMVKLHHTERGKIADVHKSRGLLSIEQIAWSANGRFICFSDSSKRVFAKSINPDAVDTEAAVESRMEISMKQHANGPIIQILFRPDANNVLIHTTSMVHVISLESSTVVCSLELGMAKCKWIIHPQNPGIILGFGLGTIRVLDWNLRGTHTYHYGQKVPFGTVPSEDEISNVLVTLDNKHILMQISPRNRKFGEKTLVYFDTSSFPVPALDNLEKEDPQAAVTVTPLSLPMEVSSKITHILSFLSHDRLVYISRTFSICVLQISRSSLSSLPSGVPGSETPPSATLAGLPKHQGLNHPPRTIDKELFSLPGDWISSDSLSLSMVWRRERSFLCPRNGEVAVVKCATLV